MIDAFSPRTDKTPCNQQSKRFLHNTDLYKQQLPYVSPELI